ncbi:MAG TPA: 23S rRNA (pseudouridine(1915)-N(3))-methyltransferase RlmH [Bryobacteraceae bacterium]|nr:23S rRNA (pseudouridine(1915)-N(3))-methyltransferase RlmH [Bryobacteraceae bacterium]
MKVFIYYIGKPRDPSANALAEEYVKRSTRYAKCEMREIQPTRFDLWAKHPSASKILFDPDGQMLTSQRFAELVARAELQATDLAFLVGGADGYPAGWRDRADQLLSLSRLTLPHELARVLLAEQIYRAFTILRGHPYNK